MVKYDDSNKCYSTTYSSKLNLSSDKGCTVNDSSSNMNANDYKNSQMGFYTTTLTRNLTTVGTVVINGALVPGYAESASLGTQEHP